MVSDVTLRHIRHRRFVAEYCRDWKPVRAYLAAGYNAATRSAATNASRLLRNPTIQRAIRVHLDKVIGPIEVSQAKVLRNLEAVIIRAMADGKYHAAVRAIELQARYTKAFPDVLDLPTPAVEDEYRDVSATDLGREMAFALRTLLTQRAKATPPAEPAPKRTIQ